MPIFQKFKERSQDLERLDTGDYTLEEYRLWQTEMKLIHGFWGEKRALRSTLLKEIRSHSNGRVSILDVGAGSGELLREISGWVPDLRCMLAGVEIDLTAVNTISKIGGIAAIQANALSLPFAGGAYDFAYCTLFLHHLDPSSAVRLIAEMARVASRRMFVVDLDRQPIPYYAYKWFAPLLFQRLTVDDGAVSILRSYTTDELGELASEAGLKDVRVERSRANRLILSGRS